MTPRTYSRWGEYHLLLEVVGTNDPLGGHLFPLKPFQCRGKESVPSFSAAHCALQHKLQCTLHVPQHTVCDTFMALSAMETQS